jgi:hypothetical protein
MPRTAPLLPSGGCPWQQELTPAALRAVLPPASLSQGQSASCVALALFISHHHGFDVPANYPAEPSVLAIPQHLGCQDWRQLGRRSQPLCQHSEEYLDHRLLGPLSVLADQLGF